MKYQALIGCVLALCLAVVSYSRMGLRETTEFSQVVYDEEIEVGFQMPNFEVSLPKSHDLLLRIEIKATLTGWATVMPIQAGEYVQIIAPNWSAHLHWGLVFPIPTLTRVSLDAREFVFNQNLELDIHAPRDVYNFDVQRENVSTINGNLEYFQDNNWILVYGGTCGIMWSGAGIFFNEGGAKLRVVITYVYADAPTFAPVAPEKRVSFLNSAYWPDDSKHKRFLGGVYRDTD